MQLTIPNCPKCSELANHSVDLILGDAELSAAEQGGVLDFDYAGETEVNWDGQSNGLDIVQNVMGTIENMHDFALVGCRAGHQWISGVAEYVETRYSDGVQP